MSLCCRWCIISCWFGATSSATSPTSARISRMTLGTSQRPKSGWSHSGAVLRQAPLVSSVGRFGCAFQGSSRMLRWAPWAWKAKICKESTWSARRWYKMATARHSCILKISLTLEGRTPTNLRCRRSYDRIWWSLEKSERWLSPICQ